MQTDEFIFYRTQRLVRRAAQKQAQPSSPIIVSFTGYFGGRGTLCDRQTHSAPTPQEPSNIDAPIALSSFNPESDVFKLT